MKTVRLACVLAGVVALLAALTGCGAPSSFDANADGVVAGVEANGICIWQSGQAEKREILKAGPGETLGTSLRWSPKGDRIAFLCADGAGLTLKSAAADGTAAKEHMRIGGAGCNDAFLPFWSPAGGQIGLVVYGKDKDEESLSTLFLVDTNSGRKVGLECARIGLCASFSPSGKRVLLTKSDVRGEDGAVSLGELAVYDLELRSEERLAGLLHTVFNWVAWIDEENILFSAPAFALPLAIKLDEDRLDEDRVFRFAIYRMNLATRRIVPVVGADAHFFFALSPDRTQIVFLRYADGQKADIAPEDGQVGNVCVVGVDGANLHKLASCTLQAMPFWVGKERIGIVKTRPRTAAEEKLTREIHVNDKPAGSMEVGPGAVPDSVKLLDLSGKEMDGFRL